MLSLTNNEFQNQQIKMYWGYAGPNLITSLFKKYCYGEDNRALILESCKEIKILTETSLHAIPWNHIDHFFQPRTNENDLKFHLV